MPSPDSPLTPAGEARDYALRLRIDATTTLLRLIEEAWAAGYAYGTQPSAAEPKAYMPPDPWLLREAPPSTRYRFQTGFEIPSAWRPLLHTRGELPCGKPAMYLTRPVVRGAPGDLSVLRILPDFRAPTPADPPRCGSCGVGIDPYSNQDLDWEPHFVDHPSSHPPRSAPLEQSPSDIPPHSDVGLATDGDDGPEDPMPDVVYPASGVPTASTSVNEDVDSIIRLAQELYAPPLPQSRDAGSATEGRAGSTEVRE